MYQYKKKDEVSLLWVCKRGTLFYEPGVVKGLPFSVRKALLIKKCKGLDFIENYVDYLHSTPPPPPLHRHTHPTARSLVEIVTVLVVRVTKAVLTKTPPHKKNDTFILNDNNNSLICLITYSQYH